MIDEQIQEHEQVEQVEQVEQQETTSVEERLQEPNEVEDKVQANFRAIRESKEKAERERDDLYRRIKEMEQASAKKQTTEESDDNDDDFSIAEDEFVEGKHLGKVSKKIKKLEKKISDYQQKSTEMAVETAIKSKYNDFDKVVSTENLEVLKKNYPEIAYTLNSTSDLYSKAVSAYTLIKNLGIYNEDKYQNEKEKVGKNLSKPRPLASVSPQQGDSPLSRANVFANGLTEELRQQLYKEMMEARENS